MSKIECVIIRDFKRPNKVLVGKFGNMTAANLDDCMSRISAIHEDIQPVNKGRLLGPAFIVKVLSGDNLMLHTVMGLVRPGDMIVIDTGGDVHRPIFGKLMMTYYRRRNIARITVDGSSRDMDTMSQLTDFPMYARGITPDGPYRSGSGEVNIPIICSGRPVNPGSIVIGDEGGVISINPSDAPGLLERVNKLHESEIRIINTIKKGGTYIHPWINEKLEGPEAEHVNYVEY